MKLVIIDPSLQTSEKEHLVQSILTRPVNPADTVLVLSGFSKDSLFSSLQTIVDNHIFTDICIIHHSGNGGTIRPMYTSHEFIGELTRLLTREEGVLDFFGCDARSTNVDLKALASRIAPCRLAISTNKTGNIGASADTTEVHDWYMEEYVGPNNTTSIPILHMKRDVSTIYFDPNILTVKKLSFAPGKNSGRGITTLKKIKLPWD